MSELHDLGAEFTRREIEPHLQQWEDDGTLPRELHLAAAKQGLLGVAFPEEVGGQGGTLLDSVDLQEGMFEAGASSGLMAGLFTSGIALPAHRRIGQRRPDRPVRPAHTGRREDRLARGHRARRRLRRRRHPDHGGPGGRGVRPQRRQDLHHQWGPRRLRDHRRPHRRAGDMPASV